MKFDEATLIAAAMIIKRQSRAHSKKYYDSTLPEEARRAHKFVATNCDRMASLVLQLDGKSETEANGIALAIHEKLAKEEP